MARPLRISEPGIPLHIVQRGNNRAACFVADDDRFFYLDQLTRHAETAGCAVHAYVLMSNHVHLLISPSDDAGVSRLMQNLGRSYVQAFNRAHRRTGTLWEGRYKAALVADRGYVLACYRYIEMNPVRAGIVASPDAYPWSSHRLNAAAARSRLVTPHGEYLALGNGATERAAAYRALIRDQLAEERVRAIRTQTWANGRI